MSFEIEETAFGNSLPKMGEKQVRKVNHKEGKPHGIGHGCGLDVHEIFEAPKLFGVSKIELSLPVTMHP